MSDIEISSEWFTGKVEQEVLNAAMIGLLKGGQIVVGESQNNCPVLSGTLKRSITVTKGGLPNETEVFSQANSGNVEQGQTKGEELAVYISGNTPYARKQHEQHESKSKFLERGLQAVEPRLQGLIEREIKKL